MKKIVFLAVFSVACFTQARPEFHRTEYMNNLYYLGQKVCPIDYCKEPDNGFSMRAWCNDNHSPWGSSQFLVGWTQLSGVECFCGCNNLW